MLSGHLGTALIMKMLTGREYNLGTLFFATQFPDVLMMLTVYFGYERFYYAPEHAGKTFPLSYSAPITHSLLGTLLGTLFLVVWHTLWRSIANRKDVLILGFGVWSHWLLDALVHRGTLQILPDLNHPSNFVGLGLWDHDPKLIFTMEVASLLIPTVLVLYTSTLGRGVIRKTLLITLVFLHLIGQYDMNFVAIHHTTAPGPKEIPGMIVTILLVMVLAYFADGNATKSPDKEKLQ